MCNKEMVVDVHQMSEPWNVQLLRKCLHPRFINNVYTAWRIASAALVQSYGLKLQKGSQGFVDWTRYQLR